MLSIGNTKFAFKLPTSIVRSPLLFPNATETPLFIALWKSACPVNVDISKSDVIASADIVTDPALLAIRASTAALTAFVKSVPKSPPVMLKLADILSAVIS